MGTKKYYWLKLKQDFFNNLRMKKLRSIAGGDTYTIIYLKMQLLSLQNEGVLFYEGVEESFEQEIALLIDENVEDVRITINFLILNNLLIETKKGEYELIETKTCIGSETDKAEFMRQLRQKQKEEKQLNSNNVTNMLPSVTNCYTEKEIDIEKEKEKEKEIDKKIEVMDIWEKQFEDFYKQYPRKVKKQDVKKWFNKNKPSKELFNKIIDGLNEFKKSKDWTKDNGQYIPHPTTWLNQKRWEDENIIQKSNTILALQRAWERGE